MRRLVVRQVTFCDHCEKEAACSNRCRKCGAEYCFPCARKRGRVYYYVKGNGYYCTACDRELAESGGDESHTLFRQMHAIREEAEAASDAYYRKLAAVEKKLIKVLNAERKATPTT